MKLNKSIIYVVAAVLLATGAYAARETVQRHGSVFPVWFDAGIYVGSPTNPNDPTADKVHKIAAIRTCDCQNIDIPTAAAGVQTNVTCACIGVALGDVIVGIGPQQDDAAFDDGLLTGFVESANVVKIQYTADTTGGDPAATNDYFVTYIKRKP